MRNLQFNVFSYIERKRIYKEYRLNTFRLYTFLNELFRTHRASTLYRGSTITSINFDTLFKRNKNLI